MKYQAYAGYKDSGVEWLEDIPTHWDIKRTKAMFSLSRILVGKQSKDYQLLSLTLKGVVHRDISDGGGKIPAEFDTYQEVKIQDLIFCLFDIDETPRTIGLSSHDGMITGAYNVYRCLKVCIPEYAYYYFMHIDSFKGLKPFYTGLRKVVRTETFSNIKMPVPALFEQRQIANFLDHETAKIDTLIEKQQQLIKLLKEKRQAVISHAVTKGLYPNAPMRDSGVEWLGEVPKHWEVKRLKYLCDVQTGSKDTVNAIEDGKYPFFVRSQTVERINSKAFECEAVLTAGDGAGVGKVYHYINGPFDFHQRVYMLNNFRHVMGKFIFNYLERNFYKVAMTGQAKSTVDSLRLPLFLNFEVTVPPLDEQQNILAKVDNLKGQYKKLIASAEAVIELMQERRTALISAAVTGKIDVRNRQSPEPFLSSTQPDKEVVA